MGASQSQPPISDGEMQDYLDLTFLTRSEILNAYYRFQDIPTDSHEMSLYRESKYVSQISELKVNPFKERILSVFSRENDKVSFEDFLDMLSVFCEASPTSTKIEYAFRIYDFDNDGMLNRADIQKVIQHIIKDSSTIKHEDMKLIVDKVLQEADLDGDNQLSYAEFEHAMTKSIDFATTYLIRL